MDFAVNGRFLTQPVTGVQRYARNVAAAMDQALASASREAALLTPAGADDPGFAALRLDASGPFQGHLWEQTTLPRRWPGRLINLCNSAPLAKKGQVVCIHDTNVYTASDSYSAPFRLLYRSLHPLLARRAARATTVSHFSARRLGRYLGIDPKEVAVLPNGHEHALEWDPARARTAPAALDDGRPFILALGSRARHKNLALLRTLAPALAAEGLDIAVVGGGAEIFTTATLQPASNLRMLGFVTDDDLAWLMERAMCLAFPSLSEGFGLPVLEAFARGCPVVSTDRASLPELCGPAALLASPLDPEAWLSSIRRLAGSTDLRADLAGRGRERAALFSWRDTAAGYLEMMDRPESLPRAVATINAAPATVAAVIATRGRPEIVDAAVRRLVATQTLRPEIVIVSCVDADDAGDLADMPGVRVVTGPAGLPAQRNTALDALPAGIDAVVFFDDDFIADPHWLEEAAATLADEPDVVSFTGHVLADGIKGPGLSFEEAEAIVEHGRTVLVRHPWLEPYSPYGCNMAFRVSDIGLLRFDQRLVNYGWLEDRDFAAALRQAHGGRSVKCAQARGVHLGAKSGRVSGERLGYSQVVNPFYLWRKGTMTLGQVLDQVGRNITSNLVLSLKPEPFIDRRGRLRGNLAGILDALNGRLEPERAAARGK